MLLRAQWRSPALRFSTSPRLLRVRAASVSSRARCRVEIPGAASARSSVARDSADRACLHVALRQRPVQVNEEIRVDDMHQRMRSPPAPPRPHRRRGRERQRAAISPERHAGPSQPGKARALPGGGVRLRPEGPGRISSSARASQPAQYPFIHRLGLAAGSVNGRQQLPGRPGSRAGAPASARARARIAVPGGAHRHRHHVVKRRPDHRMPEPETIAGLGQHAAWARGPPSTAAIRSATPRPRTVARSGTAKSTPSSAAARST